MKRLVKSGADYLRRRAERIRRQAKRAARRMRQQKRRVTLSRPADDAAAAYWLGSSAFD